MAGRTVLHDGNAFIPGLLWQLRPPAALGRRKAGHDSHGCRRAIGAQLRQQRVTDIGRFQIYAAPAGYTLAPGGLIQLF